MTVPHPRMCSLLTLWSVARVFEHDEHVLRYANPHLCATHHIAHVTYHTGRSAPEGQGAGTLSLDSLVVYSSPVLRPPPARTCWRGHRPWIHEQTCLTARLVAEGREGVGARCARVLLRRLDGSLARDGLGSDKRARLTRPRNRVMSAMLSAPQGPGRDGTVRSRGASPNLVAPTRPATVSASCCAP